jgi:hypothetical protein
MRGKARVMYTYLFSQREELRIDRAMNSMLRARRIQGKLAGTQRLVCSQARLHHHHPASVSLNLNLNRMHHAEHRRIELPCHPGARQVELHRPL